MTETLSFSRKAFRRGVDEALTLKPLRRVLSGERADAGDEGRSNGPNGNTDATRRGTVATSGRRSWHVKRSS